MHYDSNVSSQKMKGNDMESVIKVEGMSCDHCVKSITEALTALDGVESVTVDLAAKTVTVGHTTAVSPAQLSDEIEDQGYEVV
jgi:copper ion binding protein